MTIIAIVVRMVILFYILEVLVVFLATHRVAYLPQAPGTSLDDGARKTNTQIWSNKNRIQAIPRTLQSSSDIPVLLPNHVTDPQ